MKRPLSSRQWKNKIVLRGNSALLRSRVEFFTRRRDGTPSASCIWASAGSVCYCRNRDNARFLKLYRHAKWTFSSSTSRIWGSPGSLPLARCQYICRRGICFAAYWLQRAWRERFCSCIEILCHCETAGDHSDLPVPPRQTSGLLLLSPILYETILLSYKSRIALNYTFLTSAPT